MKPVSCLRFIVLSVACLPLLADAGASGKLDPTPDHSSIRAAQLFARDGQWESVAPRSAPEERAEIRAHFAAVRQILAQDAPISLDVAVGRFENSFQLSLTPSSRAKLREKLAARREIQLERLNDYARAGNFPLNRHYAGEARPIFVDARGAHCAVGHLMALDGWESEVEDIARANPNVLVREVSSGPLVSWVLTSGLTQEEAALIQPGYFPPSTAEATNLSALIVPGATLDRNGFRYANFAFSASSTGGAATPTAAQLGIVYGWPQVAPNAGFCPGSVGCAARPDTLWFGVLASPSQFGFLYAGADQSISFDIEYDVLALSPGLAIGGTETFASSLYGGFGYLYGPASLSTSVDNDALGMLVLDIPPGPFDDGKSILFAEPVDRVHLHHRVQIANQRDFGSFDSGNLRAVPLPGAAGLLAFSLAVLGGYVQKRYPPPNRNTSLSRS